MANLAFLTEDKLKSSERTNFGLPSLKKYPMPDKAHVKAAIRMFNHVDRANEAELAENIKIKMKKYHISSDMVGEGNRLRKYINESKSSDKYEKLKSDLKSKFKSSLHHGVKYGARGAGIGMGIGALTGDWKMPIIGGHIGAIAGGGYGLLKGISNDKVLYKDIDSSKASLKDKNRMKTIRSISGISGIIGGSALGMKTGAVIGSSVGGPIGGAVGMAAGNLIGSNVGDRAGIAISNKLNNIKIRNSKR